MFQAGIFLLLLAALPAAAQEPLSPVSPEDAIKSVQEAAQEQQDSDELKALGSPQATMRTFLEAINQLWEDPSGGWADAG